MGDGPLKNEFEKYAEKKDVDVYFPGMIRYPEMMGILSSSEAAVNPIVKKSVSSIINKVGDYASAGVPVINTQNSDEYRNLLEENNAGINCDTLNDVEDAIRLLYENSSIQKEMANASKKIGEKYFDRNLTYKKIIDLIRNSIGMD